MLHLAFLVALHHMWGLDRWSGPSGLVDEGEDHAFITHQMAVSVCIGTVLRVSLSWEAVHGACAMQVTVSLCSMNIEGAPLLWNRSSIALSHGALTCI